MDTTRRVALRRLCLAVDAILIATSMAAAFGAHEALRGLVPALKAPPASQVLALGWMTLPLWLGLVVVFRLHTVFERPWTLAQSFVALVKLHAAGLVAAALLLFFTRIVVNRSVVVLFLVASFVTMLVERWTVSRWLAFQYASGRGKQSLLLVGDATQAGEAMREFVSERSRSNWPPHVVGWLGPSDASPVEASALAPPLPGEATAPREPPAALGMPPRAGSLGDIEAALAREAVDEVVFFPPLAEGPELDALVHACETRGVATSFAVTALPRRQLLPPRMSIVGGRAFLTYESASKSAAHLAVKHGVDVVAAVLLSIALAPLLLLVAIAVLITMGRPILFSQERAGRNGRRFRVHKFRTMTRDAEARRKDLEPLSEAGGPVFKMTRDPRVTRLGRLLRATSIDELPQLFNVLSGAMSLVGPRPLPIDEQQRIEGWHRRRLSMKPGITGLWQVSGRSDIPFTRWMELDLEYIDHWSLALDAKILVRTVPAVLSRRGAR